MTSDYIDLDVALNTHFPIVVIETHDEQRALRLLRKAVAVNKGLGSLHFWSAADGLDSGARFGAGELKVEGIDYQPGVGAQTRDPEAALAHIKNKLSDALVLLPDFHAYLSNPIIVRLVKEIAQQYYIKNVKLVFVSHAIDIPQEIERLCLHFEMSLPSATAIRNMIDDEIKVWKSKNGKSVSVDSKAVDLLKNNLLGLNHADVQRLIRNAIYDDGAITHSDLRSVMDAKYRMVSGEGALSFEFDTEKLADIGGFLKLKEWLRIRKPYFIEEIQEDDPDVPKGVLLLGVQGCGKSLAAKAVAGSWGVPLLRFDFSALYNKYIGETEKNIREALQAAELLAPCVLWIDEIEKAIQGSGDDTGTANRILGTLLTWMAENTARVFIVATSNDVSKLPPELMRKGRLDEIFFVDLPDFDSRKAIFKLHLERRGHDAQSFDLDALSEQADGFSGAEIEQAIISARYRARADGVTLATGLLSAEMESTSPLSIVRAEEIAALRLWAQDRTVKVH